jgi:NAD(P)-dependent dehydrogenase (short-subunit alcohol dehydrogenase family)
LNGRIALVTGGGRGIGRAVALDLARAGTDVLVSARTGSEIEAVAGEVRALGRRAAAVTADVARPEDVRALFAAARQALGRVDVLVNAAGIAPSALTWKTDDATWRAAIETNLSGAFYCMREALPGMLEAGWGRVVNVASIAGKTGYAYISAYAASKHGLLGLTKCAAIEVATKGVTVNAVCPGYVDTPLTDETIARIMHLSGKSWHDALRSILEQAGQPRLIRAAEVAEIVVGLCADQAGMRNGEVVVIDGRESA